MNKRIISVISTMFRIARRCLRIRRFALSFSPKFFQWKPHFAVASAPILYCTGTLLDPKHGDRDLDALDGQEWINLDAGTKEAHNHTLKKFKVDKHANAYQFTIKKANGYKVIVAVPVNFLVTDDRAKQNGGYETIEYRTKVKQVTVAGAKEKGSYEFRLTTDENHTPIFVVLDKQGSHKIVYYSKGVDSPLKLITYVTIND